MKYFNIVLGILIFAVFAWFAHNLINNTKPQKVKDCVVTINVTAEPKAANGRSVRITQKALEDALQQSAYAARQEAQNEYDKNFSTLLTILTIFGIAWPLVVAFAQYKFNERELDKIQVAEKNASDSVTMSKEARDKANKALEEAKETDLLVKNLADLFKSSSSDQWEMLSLVYTKSAIRINKSGEDTKFPSTLNFNRLMNVWCKCFKIQFGQLNKLNTSNADIIKNYLSNISPEEKPDDMSPINKAVVKSIIKSLDSFIERNQEQPVRESLDDLKKMAMALLDAYKKLVPDGSPEDLIV